MINPNYFFDFLKKNKVTFFAGVPDSILKNTKNYLNKINNKNHIVTANEGLAVSACVGYHLSTNNLACAYMQNSGLGNALNPLISIAHQKVYSIPMLLLIGWRGSPGMRDEPQHELKGKITPDLLQLLGIKYCTLSKDKDFNKLKKLILYAKRNKQPVACLIKKNTFEALNSKKKINIKKKINSLKRVNFINELLSQINKKTKIVATTGFTSRELNQIRNDKKIKKGSDFYMVGGMGHSSMVALGASLKSRENIICLDGDGSFLMHLGAIVSVAKNAGNNFKHILLNNYSHESVGGQPTNIEKLNLKNLVKSAGYKKFYIIKNIRQTKKTLNKFIKSKGPSFLEVKIKSGSMESLKRPKDFLKIKKNFMKSFK
jgi:phosphonopyruvate decarboxylase